MTKNYFEHEIKVKFVDNILSKSTEWDWFINYIEDNFYVDFKIYTSKEFITKFVEIKDVLIHLNKINEINDQNIFNKDWLKDINMISLFYIGKISLEELDIKSDFIRLLALYTFSAKIANEHEGKNYLIYMDIYQDHNVFDLCDVSGFVCESEKIFGLIEQLDLDFSEEKKIFQDNINHVFYPCHQINNQLLEMSDYYNAFSFYNSFDLSDVKTWEDRCLLDLLSVSFEKGKFTPKIQYTDGTSYPDFNFYTPKIVSKLKAYYKGTDAEFLIESIDYVFYGNIPSQKTIDKHFALLKDNINDYDDQKGFHYLMCSSLEFVLSFFVDNAICTDDKIADFNIMISKIDDIQYFSYLKESNAPIGKNIIQKLRDYSKEKALEIEKVNNIQEFFSYIKDDDIVSIVNQDIFYKISDKFEETLENVDTKDKILIAWSFLNYLLLLIKIKNNKDIISNEVYTEIIYIRGLWKETYFDVCSESLSVFSDLISVPNQEIEQLNLKMLDKPFAFASKCLSIKDEKIITSMENISQNPLSFMASTININEDFPVQQNLFIDNKHPIDMIVKKAFSKLHSENQHRFLNNLSITEYMQGIYQEIQQNFSIYFSMFNKTQDLYEIVCAQNAKYKFIEYAEQPSLAHLTQLFPVLENKIREVGEFFTVSPICEKIEKYSKLKEPSGVLNKIIEFLYTETEKLIYASDFLFIHFALFAENGLNIRNECIHGNKYNIKDEDITFAFKVTLFCLYLLEYRIKIIRSQVSSLATNQDID